MNQSGRRFLLVLCGIGLTLGCRFTAPTPVAWRGTATAEKQWVTASAQAPKPASTETSTPKPSATVARVQTSIPSDGPWFIFLAKDGTSLMAADRDTNQVRQIELPEGLIAADLPKAVSSDRTSMLVRAGSTRVEGEYSLFHISDSNLTPQRVTGLISVAVQNDLLDSNNRQAVYALQAAIAPVGIDWNPIDGKAVFPMAVDGNFTNLFTFNPDSQKVDRITSRYQQDLAPIWSTGGQVLVFQEADTLNNPYHWRVSLVASIFTTNLERVNYLYSPATDSVQEVYVGWVNETRLLMFTQTETTKIGLRLLNVNGGTPTVLYDQAFDQVAMNPVDGSIALLLSTETAEKNRQAPGIYLRTSGFSGFSQVLLGEYQSLEFDGGSARFTASNDSGAVLFDKNGVSQSVPRASHASTSPDGQWMVAWSASGASLYRQDGDFLQEITTEPVEYLAWDPDSKGFHFIQMESLFYSQFPRLTPIRLTDDVFYEGEAWFNWLGSGWIR